MQSADSKTPNAQTKAASQGSKRAENAKGAKAGASSKVAGYTDKDIAMNILVDQAVPEGSKAAEKIRSQKNFQLTIIELLCFMAFAVTSISHTILGHTQHDLFETTQAIENEMNSLPKKFTELREFNDLWDWIGDFQAKSIRAVESEDGKSQ